MFPANKGKLDSHDAWSPSSQSPHRPDHAREQVRHILGSRARQRHICPAGDRTTDIVAGYIYKINLYRYMGEMPDPPRKKKQKKTISANPRRRSAPDGDRQTLRANSPTHAALIAPNPIRVNQRHESTPIP